MPQTALIGSTSGSIPDRGLVLRDKHTLLNQSTMTLYKGFECHRNRLTGRFYAIPIADDSLTRKIVRDSPEALKQAIDEATEAQRPNPWELAYATSRSIAA
jgi:hypothetical protein